MGKCGTGAGQMKAPRGVVADGNTAYVVETGDTRISVWNWPTGQQTATYKPSCGGKGLTGLGRRLGSQPHLDLHR